MRGSVCCLLNCLRVGRQRVCADAPPPFLSNDSRPQARPGDHGEDAGNLSMPCTVLMNGFPGFLDIPLISELRASHQSRCA